MNAEQIEELRERSKDDRAVIVGSEIRQLCGLALSAPAQPDAGELDGSKWLNDLRAVLCDPEDIVCISGSDGDREVITHALRGLSAALTAQRARIAELTKQVATEYVRGRQHEQNAKMVADSSWKQRAEAANAALADCKRAICDVRKSWSDLKRDGSVAYKERISNQLNEHIETLSALCAPITLDAAAASQVRA